MMLRSKIEKCIKGSADPETASKLIMACLYDIGLLEPGNGWIDDDLEAECDLDARWFSAWKAFDKDGTEPNV